MFEVGKRYRPKNIKTGRQFVVLMVGNNFAFIRDSTGEEGLFPKEWFEHWEEDVVHTEECFVKFDKHEGFWTSDDNQIRPENIIGKVRFTYTEGGDFTVEKL